MMVPVSPHRVLLPSPIYFLRFELPGANRLPGAAVTHRLHRPLPARRLRCGARAGRGSRAHVAPHHLGHAAAPRRPAGAFSAAAARRATFHLLACNTGGPRSDHGGVRGHSGHAILHGGHFAWGPWTAHSWASSSPACGAMPTSATSSTSPAIVGADGFFVNVTSGHPGSVGDAYVWSRCSMQPNLVYGSMHDFVAGSTSYNGHDMLLSTSLFRSRRAHTQLLQQTARAAPDPRAVQLQLCYHTPCG